MDAPAMELVGGQHPVSISLATAMTDLPTNLPFDDPEQNLLQILEAY